MLLDELLAFQRDNILFAIQLYESGQLPPAPGKQVCIMDGKIIGGLPAKISQGAKLWFEVYLTLILPYYFTCSTLRDSFNS